MGEKHDAFGREIGEDTLADTGWRSSSAPAPPIPVSAPTEAAPSEAAPSFTIPAGAPVTATPPPTVFDEVRAARRPRVRVRTARPLRLLFVVAIIGVVAAAASSVLDSVREVTDIGRDIAGDLRDVQPGGSGDGPAAEPSTGTQAGGAVRGLEPSSLLRPERMSAALDRLGDTGNEPLMLRIAPERIDTQLRDGPRLRIVQLTGDGDLRVIATTDAPAGAPGLDLRAINPRAPRRLLLAAKRRHDLEPRRIDYLVAMDFNGDVLWNAFYTGGAAHVQGDARGRLIRRVS